MLMLTSGVCNRYIESAWDYNSKNVKVIQAGESAIMIRGTRAENRGMRKCKTQTFTASISRENEWFIAQCLEVDIASQGKSEDEAVDNLREALELYFEPPRPTVMPKLRKFEAEHQL